jgi:predicted RNA-binding protein associated with RNAse of E/G family
MNFDSQYTNYSTSLESIPDISYEEHNKFGQCTDVESLKRVYSEKFLYMNSNHIIVIKNGYKFGDRRLNLEEKMLNKRNI